METSISELIAGLIGAAVPVVLFFIRRWLSPFSK